MQVKENNRKDIEARFMSMNDFVKMDYLSSCLKNPLDFDTRKFVLIKLAELFENKGMFIDAGKYIRTAAEINTSRQNKIDDFLKAVGLFIKAGDYEEADITHKKMIPLLEEGQARQIEAKIKESYKVQGKLLIEKNKRKQAIDLYEELASMNLSNIERDEVQKKLLELYEGVGDVSSYRTLKRKISGIN